MGKCNLCDEKQIEIERILKSYKNDKRKFQKEKKKYQIIILSLFGLCLLITAFGPNGIKIMLELVEKIVR
jgi:hypothetical protein